MMAQLPDALGSHESFWQNVLAYAAQSEPSLHAAPVDPWEPGPPDPLPDAPDEPLDAPPDEPLAAPPEELLADVSSEPDAPSPSTPPAPPSPAVVVPPHAATRIASAPSEPHRTIAVTTAPPPARWSTSLRHTRRSPVGIRGHPIRSIPT